MGGLIITPAQKGYSDPMTVAGRKGRFNWNAAPHYDRGIGSGRSPMYLYETEDGQAYYHRLEEDLQGGRWEESGQSDEYDMMKQDPGIIKNMWGDSDVAAALMEAIAAGAKWEDLPKYLKQVNTWRQISGD